METEQNKDIEPTSYFGIVIDELPPDITADTLKPKVQQQTEHGNYIHNKDDSPLLIYYSKETHDNLED